MDLEDSSWKSATSPRRLVHKPPLKGVTPHGVGRCPQGRGDRSVRGGPPLGGGGVPPQSVTSSAAMSKPSGGIRSLHSLSACGLPTPIVALACIGNVDIQVFSCADGKPYFLRRFASLHIASPERGGEPPLGDGGVSPCIIRYSNQPISQRVTLLFFFTEKKKRSKKRKELAYPCIMRQCITRRLH